MFLFHEYFNPEDNLVNKGADFVQVFDPELGKTCDLSPSEFVKHIPYLRHLALGKSRALIELLALQLNERGSDLGLRRPLNRLAGELLAIQIAQPRSRLKANYFLTQALCGILNYGFQDNKYQISYPFLTDSTVTYRPPPLLDLFGLDEVRYHSYFKRGPVRLTGAALLYSPNPIGTSFWFEPVDHISSNSGSLRLPSDILHIKQGSVQEPTTIDVPALRLAINKYQLRVKHAWPLGPHVCPINEDGRESSIREVCFIWAAIVDEKDKKLERLVRVDTELRNLLRNKLDPKLRRALELFQHRHES